MHVVAARACPRARAAAQALPRAVCVVRASPARWAACSPSSTPEQVGARMTMAARQPNARRASTRASGTPASDDRVAAIFYDARVAASLTPRQRTVFESLATAGSDVPAALLADHGFLYGADADELAGRSEAVRRALSTRTGSTRDQLAFRKAELLRKYGRDAADSGASRVQVAMMTEGINRMAAHLAANHHDKHCKRALAILSVRRRRLLEYMMRRDYQNYVRCRRARRRLPVPSARAIHYHLAIAAS